jgi:CxxC motif-containing protein (DUF1111 family)
MKRIGQSSEGNLAHPAGKPNQSWNKGVVIYSGLLVGLLLATGMVMQGQNSAHDFGPRGAPVGAGGPITGLIGDPLRFFNDGATRFVNAELVVPNGLGPTFNGNSCGICHSQPAIGGSSPSLNAFPNIGQNPQVALATDHHGMNKLPFFVKPDGPVREARFKFVVENGRVDRDDLDGGVHDLFTIQGRDDLPTPNSCVLAQENFQQAQDQDNLSLRIPTPVFGGGLIEMIDDATILANLKANGAEKSRLGIRGRANRSANDGTITRFGWKAQNKSLIMFSHEAYSVEIGETNQMFPQKRGFGGNPPPAACVFNPLPEDYTNYLSPTSDPLGVPSDDDAFATFMRFLDQPAPVCTGSTCSPSIRNGQTLFTDVVKCALCHTPSMTTRNSTTFPVLSSVQANLFSDLALHHMGSGLRDDISQGIAGPDEFRTSPLWGLGQRVFFLHDGRTSDLLEVIRQHASPGSEANGVVRTFDGLNESQKQDLLNFLRSL